MLKRWLEKKFSTAQRDEALQFLEMLKGANVDVVADVAARAMIAAALFNEQTSRNLYEVSFWAEHEPTAALSLGREIKQFQREGKPRHAVGFMVWLHTTRAASFPELKAVAREIWNELERAPVEHEAFARLEMLSRSTGLSLQSEPGQRPFDFERL